MMNTPISYSVEPVMGDYLKHYKFSISELAYFIDIVNSPNSDHLRVQFTLIGKGTGIYHTGNAFKVFSAVLYILHIVMKETGKTKLSFSSHLHLLSRIKLYDRFCSFMVKKGSATTWFYEDDSRYREYEITF